MMSSPCLQQQQQQQTLQATDNNFFSMHVASSIVEQHKAGACTLLLVQVDAENGNNSRDNSADLSTSLSVLHAVRKVPGQKG
jgi:diphthamide biosynthesis methyltransferase